MRNEELKAFMARQGWGLKKAALKLGVSVTTVSQYVNGKYPTNTDWIDEKVAELVALHQSKIVVHRYNEKFVPTLVAKRGMEKMAIAQANVDLAVIYGAAGLGKTQMLKQYAKEHSSAILIETDPSFSPKVLLRKIAEAVGVASRGNLNEMFEGIVAKLEDSDRLLMIDEAEALSTRCLEFVRRIHDKARIGVVLAGMPRLLVNLKGKNNELAQLYGRGGLVQPLGNTLPTEDLALLAESALGTDEFNAELIAHCHGNARRLSKLIRGVLMLSEINEMPISGEMIKEYSKMLIS